MEQITRILSQFYDTESTYYLQSLQHKLIDPDFLSEKDHLDGVNCVDDVDDVDDEADVHGRNGA